MTDINTVAEIERIDAMPRIHGNPELCYLQDNGRQWLKEIARLRTELEVTGDQRDLLLECSAEFKRFLKEDSVELGRLRSEVARLKAANGHLQQELAMRPQR